MYITLQQVKAHLVIDFLEDDTYLTDLIAVCETTIENHINDKLSNLAINGAIPDPLKHAILLLIGNYYANREPVSFTMPSKVPYTIDYLIETYKNYA